MNSVRKFVGFVLALALAAFALPGIAAPEKKFSVAVSPASLTAGTVPSPGISVRIKNETPNGNSSINSLTIQLPTGFTLTAKPTTAYSGVVNWSGAGATSFSVTNMSPLKPNEQFFVSLPGVSISSTICGTGAWGATAWTGSSLSGDTFLRVAPSAVPSGYATATEVISGLSLTISPFPANIVAGATSNIGVNLNATCGTPPQTSVTLTASGATGGGTKTTIGGSTSFAITFGMTPGTSTLTASATGYDNRSETVTVWGGELACADTTPVPGEAGWFSASPPGALDSSYTAYAEGYRGSNKTAGPCVPINYTFTNTIPVTGNVTDALGRTIPPNGVSLVWGNTSGQDPAFAYTVTFKPEYADALGYPSKKTKYCTAAPGGDCTGAIPANLVDLPGCSSSLVAFASIPGGAPACLGGEMWTTLLPTDCPAYTGSLVPTPACIKVTNRIIDAADPPIIRD